MSNLWLQISSQMFQPGPCALSTGILLSRIFLWYNLASGRFAPLPVHL